MGAKPERSGVAGAPVRPRQPARVLAGLAGLGCAVGLGLALACGLHPGTPQNLKGQPVIFMANGRSFALLDPSQTAAAATQTAAASTPTATATTAPTATPQATPLPTPLPGFALYVDAKSSFLIQYPDTWSKENLVPSIQFYDSTQSTYVVTILPADPNNAPPSTNATAAAMNWVDATLNGIQQEETVQNFERLSGPTPAVTIGGQAWQSGVATFGPTDAPNRVQVYATVFDGQPYVITLVAPDDLFETGQDLYFKPMLATFQFLTPSL